jgi:Cdc6-like AAA superfamily ATPase
VRTAVEQINHSKAVHIQTWEDARVGGKVIIDTICRAIDGSDLLLADLTGLNPNVLFEVGYAIAKKKRIWPILDAAISGTDFTDFRTLSTVGCGMYENSVDIIKLYAKEKPHEDLGAALLDTIAPSVPSTGGAPSLLYLKSQNDTDASIRITRRLDAVQIGTIVDDPREVPWQTLAWYGERVSAADAVVCHLTSANRTGARIRNARYALVSGLAFGLAKHVLILIEGDDLAPLDYRDMLKQYQTAAAAVRHLEAWLAPLEAEWSESVHSRRQNLDRKRRALELKSLNLGDYIAENEGDGLVDGYFIETAAYQEALDGTHTVFVGRKGTGKSANFLQLASRLRADSRNLLSVIKPVAYELESILRILGQLTDRDKKVFVVEGLWKFLLYSDVALSLVNRIEAKALTAHTNKDLEFIDFFNRHKGVLRGDFSSRLEQCIETIGQTTATRIDGSTKDFREVMSETLHSVVLKELRERLVGTLPPRARVAIIVDNLDKAWDRQNDLRSLAEFLLGLLSAARKVRQELQNSNVQVSLAVFLRADIFEKVQEVAREPDKIQYTRLVWTDKELLYKLLEERFVAANGEDMRPEDLWGHFFCATVDGKATKEFLADAILPRPRDFLYLTKAAIATAVNRSHERVEEADVRTARKMYSEFATSIIFIEDNSEQNIIERVVYEFAGAPSTLSYDDVRARILKAEIQETSVDSVIEQLCALTFLGVEVADGDFRFPDSAAELKKVEVLARRLCEIRNSKPSYRIHRAFHPFLENS